MYIVYETYKKAYPTHNYVGKTSERLLARKKSYMGSGDVIKIALQKYGKDAFAFRVLAKFDDEDAAYKHEERLVEEMKPYYNICGGGIGVGSGENHPNYGVPLNKGNPSAKRPMNAARNKSKKNREAVGRALKGRWAFDFSIDEMRDAVKRHEYKKDAAAELGINVKTLRKHMKPAGAGRGDY